MTKVIDIISVFLTSIREFFLGILLYRSTKLQSSNDLGISILELKRKNTIFPHPIGIVIGKGVELGTGCRIYQNVTIGTKELVNWKNSKYPIIGDNVTICANSIVYGAITIGSNVVIGAGTIVNKDIPSNSIVYGNPMKIKS